MDPTLITDVAGRLEIPSQGTLSRTLFSDDRVRVVGFAFDAGQMLTEHTASVPAIIQVVRGRLQLTLGGQAPEEVGPGSWVHMPAHLPHSVEALEPSVMLLTLLRDGR